MKPNTFIGSPIERVEDLRFLRGRGQYVDDLAPRGDVARRHRAQSRGAWPHPRASMPARRCAMPGVKAVLTAADIGRPIPDIPFRRPNPTIAPYAQPVIAATQVRYVGEPVAVVLAESAGAAEDALAAVEIEIEDLPPVDDRQCGGAGRRAAVRWHGNELRGDLRREGRRRRRRLPRCPLYAQGAVPRPAAHGDADGDARPAGRMGCGDRAADAYPAPPSCRSSTAARMAAMMDLPEAAVDYIEYDVGGGFGARGEFYPEDFLVAFAARKFGHPVKWIEDRREHFMAIAHSRETECEIEIALEPDGMILGLRGDIFVDIGAYVRPNGMTPVRNVAQFTVRPLPRPEHRSARPRARDQQDAVRHLSRARPLRGLLLHGAPARHGGARSWLDRLALRRRNLIPLAEMPYPLADTCSRTTASARPPATAATTPSTFDRCVAESRWAEKAHLQRQADRRPLSRPRHRLLHRRRRLRPARERAHRGRSAMARLRSMSVRRRSGRVSRPSWRRSPPMRSKCRSTASRCLHGSTTYLPEGFGSYGSRSTVMGGSAIVVAAKALLEKFRAAAAERFELAGERSIRRGRRCERRRRPQARACRFCR